MKLPDKPSIVSLSIVLLGDFNPLIFQPSWLAKNELIQEHEGEGNAIQVMHKELVRLDLEWVQIEVTPDRVELKSDSQPYFEVVKDLSISIFNILKNTPIKALGINHIFHFQLDKASYQEFGNRLSPLSNWEGILNDAKIARLEVIENERSDGLKGTYRVRIEPSDRLNPNGLIVNTNDHFAVKDMENVNGSSEIIRILDSKWEASKKRATSAYKDLWKKLNQ